MYASDCGKITFPCVNRHNSRTSITAIDPQSILVAREDCSYTGLTVITFKFAVSVV